MFKLLRKRPQNSYKRQGEFLDKVEKTKEYKACVEETEKQAKIEARKDMLELTGKEWGKGYCHMFWIAKKKILKEKFGIDWRTPAEMNPWIIYD